MDRGFEKADATDVAGPNNLFEGLFRNLQIKPRAQERPHLSNPFFVETARLTFESPLLFVVGGGKLRAPSVEIARLSPNEKTQ